MKIAARRRFALAGLATSTAVVAALLVSPPATAAPITEVIPGAVLNTSSTTLTFKHPTELGAGTAVLTRTGSATDTVTSSPVPIRQSAVDETTTAMPVNFADGGNTRETDGPANPGTYDVTLSNGSASDTCTACFTVASPGRVAVSSVSLSGLAQGASDNITITGANFSRGSVVEVLKTDGSVDREVQMNASPVDPIAADRTREVNDGITTSTMLRRRAVVTTSAVTGPRFIRVRNIDGDSATCATPCFQVNGAPLTSVSPTGATNNPTPATPTVTLTFRGSGLESGTPGLAYVGEPGSSTRAGLSIVGTNPRFAADRTSVTAEFDLRNAAPGSRAYQPTLTQSDGSVNACTCRFDVLQSTSPAVTSVTPATGPAGATTTVTVKGSGFSRGLRLDVSGGDVTTTSVRFVSPTEVEATFSVGANAANSARNVTPVLTNGTTGTACNGCFTVGPRQSPTPTTSSPAPDAVRPPTVRVSPSTIIAVEEKSTVSGTATPGSRIEVHAYSRPSTTYRLVRSGLVGPDGTYAFEVGPSGNTRLFARTVTDQGSADSGSIVLTVKTSLNLKVARTGTRTYRFTGSLLPKRPGQLITVFYEGADGRRVIAARARNAADGTYNVTRTFSGTGTFTFFTGTGTDNNNAANNSNRVRVTIR